MTEERYCQSCAMPMGDTDELYGSNADGSKNNDYCHYCYKDGKFTSEETLDGMIKACVPFMVEANPGMTPEQAEAQMRQIFPQLKRWASK